MQSIYIHATVSVVGTWYVASITMCLHVVIHWTSLCCCGDLIVSVS